MAPLKKGTLIGLLFLLMGCAHQQVSSEAPFGRIECIIDGALKGYPMVRILYYNISFKEAFDKTLAIAKGVEIERHAIVCNILEEEYE